MKWDTEPSWEKILSNELHSEYFQILRKFVEDECAHHAVYPSQNHVFRALHLTPFDSVKVVILGQDPYHGENQATGLAFAVEKGVVLPPSLRNIAKEIASDLGEGALKSHDLTHWAQQGLLLLNATLTVRAGMPASHQGQGWELFTDAIVKTLSDEREHIVFILWGAYAQKKGQHIDKTKHLVIESAHPSPLSASRGFFGSKPFSRTNRYLEEHGESPIKWR